MKMGQNLRLRCNMFSGSSSGRVRAWIGPGPAEDWAKDLGRKSWAEMVLGRTKSLANVMYSLGPD